MQQWLRGLEARQAELGSQRVVPFGAGPKVTGGLLMGRTDVFPEVGAAKHQYHNLESFSQRFWNHPGREAVYGITCL